MGPSTRRAAIAGVLPRQRVELFDAVQEGDHGRALAIHNQLLVVWRALEEFSTFPGRVKCAIDLRAGLRVCLVVLIGLLQPKNERFCCAGPRKPVFQWP